MRSGRPRPQHEDSGAALLLAIGFVVLVGAISAGLASLTTSSLNNRGTLEQVRDRQYAAEGAIERAISQLQTPGSVLAACGATAGEPFIAEPPLNGATIRVDWLDACGGLPLPIGTAVQRNVVFSACLNVQLTCVDSQVIVRAQIHFEQASPVSPISTYVQSWSVNR